MLSEVNQTERQIFYDTTYMWNLKENDTSELTHKTDSQTQRTNVLPKRKEDQELGINTCTVLWVKYVTNKEASQAALVGKNPPASAGDARDSGSIPRSGRSPGEGSDNSFWYYCLGNPIDRGT